MDKAEITMIENLYKNTGKTLEHWITIVKKVLILWGPLLGNQNPV